MTSLPEPPCLPVRANSLDLGNPLAVSAPPHCNGLKGLKMAGKKAVPVAPSLQPILMALGFKPNADGVWVSGTDYEIRIVPDPSPPHKTRVDYGSDILVHHTGCAKLDKPENLVVLDCILKLLRLGYPAKSLELEKTWKLGHEGKGRLDILVRNGKGVFALIECKTWGEEYAGERDKTLEDGGQLFSYFVQERSAKVLALYASQLVTGAVSHLCECIPTRGLDSDSSEKAFGSWDKGFRPDLLFHATATAYELTRPPLRKRDLLDLDRESGKGLFNSFAEVLRRHVVSDKPNAFNKIFNLFVCKIYDEDAKVDTDILDFQWKSGDTHQSVLDRLITLYRKGLSQYLQIEVIEDHFSGLSEFSFVDVFNDESFERNAAVLREVLELLQVYRIKYSGKHQFLGEFFEQLLSTGIKQEAGQFFTPVPLARFVLRSLPLEDVIARKVEAREKFILPYLIDFACGSGHFLTEGIDELTPLIDEVDISKLSAQARSQLNAMRSDYLWAREYVYGIDKDYRLAKTTKIAMFLNGDGDATVINGDGLDDFHESNVYVDKLHTNRPTVENRVFDVVAANPPFSISGFKRYVPNGATNFRLYRFLGAKSTEIECLFLERLGQLLKDGGVAGIILPLSILNNTRGVYTESRKQLLVNFRIRGLVELREHTFIATPTTVVVAFLERRDSDAIRLATATIRSHLFGKSVPACEASIELASKHLGVDIDTEKLATEIADVFGRTEAIRSVDTTLLSPELCMVLVAHLVSDEQTVAAFSGDKKVLERFLGYRFSKGRNAEGIHLLRHNGKVQSYLYDESDRENPERVSTHVRACFRGDELDVPEVLRRHLVYVQTLELVSGRHFVIRNPSDSFVVTSRDVRSLSPIGDFIDTVRCEPFNLANAVGAHEVQIVDGLTYKKEAEVPVPTGVKVLTADNIDQKTASLLFHKYRYLRDGYTVSPSMFPQPADIIVSKASGSLSHLGKCCQVSEKVDAVIGGFLFILRCKDADLAKAIFYRMLSLQFRQFVAGLKDQNISNLNVNDLYKFPWTLPIDRAAFRKAAEVKEKEMAELRQRIASYTQP